jgi:hypothetical protein
MPLKFGFGCVNSSAAAGRRVVALSLETPPTRTCFARGSVRRLLFSLAGLTGAL